MSGTRLQWPSGIAPGTPSIVFPIQSYTSYMARDTLDKPPTPDLISTVKIDLGNYHRQIRNAQINAAHDMALRYAEHVLELEGTTFIGANSGMSWTTLERRILMDVDRELRES